MTSCVFSLSHNVMVKHVEQTLKVGLSSADDSIGLESRLVLCRDMTDGVF